MTGYSILFLTGLIAVHKPTDAASLEPEASAADRARSRRAASERARARVAQALKLFAWEPSVSETQKAALKVLGTSRLKAIQRRLRTSALLPTVRAQGAGGRLTGRSTRTEVGSPARLSERADVDWAWSVQAEWALDRLLFDPQELKLEALRQRAWRLRQDVCAQVARIYFLRRRIQVLRILKPAQKAATALRRALLVARLTSELDALTGGWFSKTIQRRRGP